MANIIITAASIYTGQNKYTANIINAKPEDIAIGKAVKMTWLDITEDRALPQWKLIG